MGPSPYIPAPLEVEGFPLWQQAGDGKYYPLYYTENGDPWWPDFDQDGDGEVDYYLFHETVWIDGEQYQVDPDFDGIPDEQPQEPRPLSITGNLEFSGRELSGPWVMHVRNEEGGADIRAPFTGTTERIEEEIPYDEMVALIEEHELEEIFLELHFGLCNKGEVELQFNARTTEEVQERICMNEVAPLLLSLPSEPLTEDG